jgi:15-cis-phytoene synthase
MTTGSSASPSIVEHSRADVSAAYQVCRDIARHEAKNFYYAFIALPRPKRDAICAVYAFMRHADDLSDNEAAPRDERRAALAAWVKTWHSAQAGEATTDPVFIALADAQKRFAIPPELLDQLVKGTAMDLDPAHDGPATEFDTYATFEDLYRYCYYVASVVGLVCIRIFGYRDARAEKLAEETGVAFQLTNILRDVREDAERGRVYLPMEDMARWGVTAAELGDLHDGARILAGQRELLKQQAVRAETYYRSGRELLPLIDADSRPALWVLVSIYHRLLNHIERRQYDVFSTRVSVPTREKLTILAHGLLQVGFARLSGRA